jgi:membrane protein DedA with SNARE-associated domain
VIEPAAIALPFGFEEWNVLLQAAALAVLTFASEDLTTIAGGLLASAESIGWRPAFWGCFIGIWAGDAGLYALARGFGRPVLAKPRFKKWLDPEAIRRSEEWFRRKGPFALVICRFVPGTRLATYLASGFLRVSFGTFVAVTGVCALVWTLLIFALTDRFGDLVYAKLTLLGRGAWTLVALVAVSYLLVRIAISLTTREGRILAAARLQRWTHWEFWPAWLFYAPVASMYALLSLRHRSVTLPTVANPGIETGGFIGESKCETLAELQKHAPQLTARSVLIDLGETADRVERLRRFLDENDLTYPIILKPDQGQRGVGVRRIVDESEARRYLESVSAPIVGQELIQGPHEAGVFYIRYPSERRGRIFSITRKEFPKLVGDGRRTLRELLLDDGRARVLARLYFQRFAHRLADVPEEGETVTLTAIGNHAQGCIFRDGMDLRTDALEESIHRISKQIDGFFIGRYDVRYASREAFARGEGFKIIELNGATSEATSIYDPRNSIWSAYRTLYRQWSHVFAIAAENRAAGAKPCSIRELLVAWRRVQRFTASYPAAA